MKHLPCLSTKVDLNEIRTYKWKESETMISQLVQSLIVQKHPPNCCANILIFNTE